MQTFFVAAPAEGRCALSPEDAHHALRVLRMRPGDPMAVAYGGRRFAAVLEARGSEAWARPGAEMESPEAGLGLTLYQGLPKGDRMDMIVQKCTELGVRRIVPCLMARCVARWEGGENKLARWRRIAREAAMQSGRALVPEVADCLSAEALPAALAGHGLALLAWEEASQRLGDRLRGQQDVALVIGPEGGVTADEAAAFGALPITLGPRILRTETAGPAAVAKLLTLSGDMG